MDLEVCPKLSDHIVVTCLTSDTRVVLWRYRSAKLNATKLPPDLARVADIISHGNKTVAFVTNTEITQYSVVSEIHLNLYDYLLPIEVTCLTDLASRTRRFTAGGKLSINYIWLDINPFFFLFFN